MREPTPLDWAAGFIEGNGDPALARLVHESRLDVWQEPDYSLAPIGSDYPHWYPRTIARLTVPGDLFSGAVTNERTIGWALGEALDGHLNEWSLAPGPGRSWSNQGIAAPYRWRGMLFRSKTECRMAAALDRVNVAFWPNCRARLGTVPDLRETRESDFLVLVEGKVGILEVDGDEFHPPESAHEDHARDRAFRQHGIRVVERFSASECWATPDQVVAEFLALLHLNG
ncbi:MAG: hypothetical protein JST59_25710 [Actinobacteria bacterium]|nr:hypothetical protein [Actinomycetota bacterium]